MKVNKTFMDYARKLNGKGQEQKTEKPKKKRNWLGIVFITTGIAILSVGGYRIAYTLLHPDPWYVELIDKACSLWIW